MADMSRLMNLLWSHKQVYVVIVIRVWPMMHIGMGSLFNTMCGCEGILPVRLSYYDNHSTHFAGREGVALVLEGREGKGEGNL